MNGKEFTEIGKELRRLAEYAVRAPSDKTIMRFIESIGESFSAEEVSAAMPTLISNMGQNYPSLSEIKQALAPFRKNTAKSKSEDQHIEVFRSEETRYLKLLSEYTRLLGQEGVTKYYQAWLKVSGVDNVMSVGYIEKNLFMKSAIFDLGKANGDLKRALTFAASMRVA